MAYSIKLHELAHEEYIDAYDWYETKQLGLGERFMLEVEKVLIVISEHPQRYPKVKRNYRKAIIKGFPHQVVFEFYPRLKIIHIASIRHMKRQQRGRFRRKQ